MIVVDFVQAVRIKSDLRTNGDGRELRRRTIYVQPIPHNVVGGCRHEYARLIWIQERNGFVDHAQRGWFYHFGHSHHSLRYTSKLRIVHL